MQSNSSRAQLLMLTLVCAVSSSASVYGQDRVKLQIAGLTLEQKDPASEFGQGLSQMRQPGLEVDLHFKASKETVLSLDSEQTSLELKQDDGQVLPLAEMFDGNYRFSVQESLDTGLVTLRTEDIPAKGTKQLKLEGELALVVGRELKTVDVAIVLEEGKELKFGPLKMTVGQIGEAYGEPFKQSIELTSKSPFDSIAKVEFLDAKGKAVESSNGGSGSSGFNGDVTYSRSWQVASEAKTITARVSYFSKTELLKVPCNLDFGLGL